VRSSGSHRVGAGVRVRAGGATVVPPGGFVCDGGDVQARLPVLSAWLGHIDPKSTYYYLSAVPELLALAAGRLERAEEEASS
jgi:hypothetical protein